MKNVRMLGGKPLIAHTIESARRSRYLSRVVVSTEDIQIAEIASRFGAEVIRRPKALASSRAQTVPVVAHALEVLTQERYRVDVVVLLQPTSPLRTAADIDRAIELFARRRCDAVISMCEVKHAPRWAFAIHRGYLVPATVSAPAGRREVRRIFVPNGAIYVARPRHLQHARNFYSGRVVPYIMPASRSIDIDEEADFRLAELLVGRV